MDIVLNFARMLRSLPLLLSIAVLGCHAQTSASPQRGVQAIEPGTKLTPEEARRVEVMIRSRATQIRPEYQVLVGTPTKSSFPGFVQITVTILANGTMSHPMPFLLSNDGKTLAQMNTFDLSEDPKDKISAAGRPSRGGPENAPVTIVGFDDLECPFCAKMHEEIFPAVLNRYHDQVRIVYRDLPLEEIHPWALHAAIDANCLGALSGPAYWNYVDYVHAHAADMAGAEKTAAKADLNLDKAALDEGERNKLNQPELAACIQKQDATKVKASEHEAEASPLEINQTPVLFVNGERLEGVVPLDTLYKVIDRALIAAGQTPPPEPAAQDSKGTPAAVAPKPGN